MNPPIYVKYKEKGKHHFAGPFLSDGAAESHILRCEYSAKGIEWKLVTLEEKKEYETRAAPEPEVEPKRGPGRPRKETPLSEPDETAG